MTLTEEQLERIRQNRENALRIKRLKLQQQSSAASDIASTSSGLSTVIAKTETSSSGTRPAPLGSHNESIHNATVHHRVANQVHDGSKLLGTTVASSCPTSATKEGPGSALPSTAAGSNLNEEQMRRIHMNREKALNLRKQKVLQERTGTAGVAGKTSVPSSAHLPTTPVRMTEVRSPLRSSVTRPEPPPSSPATNLPKSKILVQLTIHDSDSIMVNFFPYHDAINTALRNIPSRRYDPKVRRSYIAIRDLKKAEQLLKSCKEVVVTVESVPDNVCRLLTEGGSRQPVPTDLGPLVGRDLMDMAYEYQREGIVFGIERKGRVLIADEMGLGKSIQALGIARYFRADWPLLIVCPASMTIAWQQSIKLFLSRSVKEERVTVVAKKSDELPQNRMSTTVAIMSYDQMCNRNDELIAEGYQTIIFDESHMLKDRKAKRTSTAIKLAKKARHTILLSGTPALSRPAELYSQIRIVDPTIFPKFEDFAVRYCDAKQTNYGLEAKGCSNSEELTAILKSRIMIRRLKKDVLVNLPPKVRKLVMLSGNKIDTRMCNLQHAKAEFERVNQNGNKSAKYDSLLEYYRQTGIVKASAVCENIIDTYFGENVERQKVIIFAHHQIVLDTIQSEVTKRQLDFIRIDGSTSQSQRSVLCERFQTKEDCWVAVLSITAAGVGITLTAAATVVFAELHWTPGVLQQAEDRAHRVGQTKEVVIQYMIARNTADDVIYPMIQRKMNLLGQVSLNSENFADAEKSHKTFDTRVALEISEWLESAENEETVAEPEKKRSKR